MRNVSIVLVTALGLALAACQPKDKDSPLVAKVGDQRITLADVQIAQPGATAATVDPATLGKLINRALLAQAAHDEKLDQTPAFKDEIARGTELSRATAKARKASQTVVAPTAAEIDAFIAAHPEAFAQRRFLVLDQVTMRRPDKPLPLNDGETLITLEQVQAKLAAAGLPYQRQVMVVDTATTPPAAVARLLTLGTKGLFEITGPTAVAEARLLQVTDAPLSGPAARDAAAAALKAERGSAAVAKAVEALRTAAGDKIVVQGGYSAIY